MSDGFLAARSVSVALGRRSVLTDISLDLPRQGLVALVGPNGAGKTTLLRAIGHLLSPQDRREGLITIGGRDVGTLSLAERARQIAYLPQGHAVHWPLPVHDVVALGRVPHGAGDPDRLSEENARAVARAMAATDVTPLAARPVTELSGGERSRVALARVLAVEAPVILADEPIASLDPRWQLDVMSILFEAGQSRLVVMVTHDLGLAARFAAQVLVLKDGRLAASGPADRVLDDRMLADVFGIRAFRIRHDGSDVLVPWTKDAP